MPEFYDAKKVKEQIELLSNLLKQVEAVSDDSLRPPGAAATAWNDDVCRALRDALHGLKLGVQRYVSFLETTNDGIWVLNADLNTAFINDQACEMLGRSAKDILGRSPLELVCNHHRRLLESWLRLRRHHATQNIELCLLHADDSQVHVSASATPLLDDHGTVHGVLALLRNVSEQKQVESTASAARSQLQRILEAMPESFHVLDHDLRFVYVNPGAVKLFGKPAHELLGHRANELFPPTPDIDYAATMRHAMKTGIMAQYVTYYEPFGRWFEVRATPAPQGLAVYTRDITVEKEALRHKDAILDGIASQVALLDARGKIIEVNKALGRLYRCPRPVRRWSGLKLPGNVDHGGHARR